MKNARSKLLVAASIATLCTPLAACGDSDDDADRPAGAGERKKGDAPSRDVKVLDASTAKGDFPATLASTTVEDPGALKVRVTPKPAASTALSWTVACRKGTRAGTKSGSFKVTDKSTKTLKKPLRRSDTCNVSASAQMSKRGTVKVEILG